jgi:hypothetical protein
MKNSERLFGYALEAERLASHMSHTDPARRVYQKNVDVFLADAAREEQEGR